MAARVAMPPHNESLSGVRELSLPLWIKRRAPESSVLVQIGANTHRKSYSDHDPGTLCVSRRWRAVLLEPVPQTFLGLKTTYAGRESERLQLVNAAVCANKTADTPAATCSATASQAMWYVDASNATGNWGTNHSDARCVQNSGMYGWVNEIASLNRRYVLGRSYLMGPSRSSTLRCQRCARLLGRPLPGDCLSRVISDNLRRADVRCFCLRKELRLAQGEPAVTLLVVDTEGFDLKVLQQYPFSQLPTWYVAFEAIHLGRNDYDLAAALLRRHGFVHVRGGPGASVSEWRHNGAPAT